MQPQATELYEAGQRGPITATTSSRPAITRKRAAGRTAPFGASSPTPSARVPPLRTATAPAFSPFEHSRFHTWRSRLTCVSGSSLLSKARMWSFGPQS